MCLARQIHWLHAMGLFSLCWSLGFSLARPWKGAHSFYEIYFNWRIIILWYCVGFCCTTTWISCSVQFSCSVMSGSLRPHGLQHARPPCLPPTPRVYSNSCSLCRWCNPTISSSVVSFFPPSIFPSIRVFSNESVLTSGGQNIGISASASVLPMNIQDWFSLGWTGWVSLQSKRLSRVSSSTTV